MEHRFGGVVIDTTRERVTIRGEAVHTTPRVFATLRVLVERAGVVVTREALLRDVWCGRAGARVARVAAVMAAALVLALAAGSRTSHGPVSGRALSVAQELDAGYREGRARLATRTGRDMRLTCAAPWRR